MYQPLSNNPLIAKKFSHFKPQLVAINSPHKVSHVRSDSRKTHPKNPHPSVPTPEGTTPFYDHESLNPIKINDAVFSKDQQDRVCTIHQHFSLGFNNDLTGGYNHSSGRFFADFSFSSRPPPTKVFVPQYNRKCADLQQSKCGKLERQGVHV